MWVVISAKVRSFISGSLQTPRTWDPHWEFVAVAVVVVVDVTSYI